MPYRVLSGIAFMAGCFATVIFSEYQKSLFAHCVFFMAFSFAFHLLMLAFLFIKKKNKNEKEYVDVITLCDIPKKEYGNVYFDGNRYRIKNESEKSLKKGDVLQVKRQDLF